MITDKTPDNGSKILFGVRAKLLVSYTLIALTTVAACSIGFYSFSIIERSIARITNDSVPDMTSAMTLAQNSSYFETTVPLLASANTDAERDAINARLSNYIDNISTLAEKIDDNPAIFSVIEDLRGISLRLNSTAGAKIISKNSLNESVTSLVKLQRKINKQLLAGLDDAGFNLELEAEDIQAISTEALDNLVNQSLVEFSAALELKADLNSLLMIFTKTAFTDQPTALAVHQQTASALIEKINDSLAKIGQSHIQDIDKSIIDDFIENATGEPNIFDARSFEIEGTQATNLSQQILQSAVDQLPGMLATLKTVVNNIYSELIASAETAQEMNSTGIPRLMDPGVSNLRLLLEYRANSNILFGLLSQAAQLRSGELLVPVVERLLGIEASLTESLDALVAVENGASMAASIRQLITFGKADDGIISLKKAELEALSEFQQGLASAKTVLDQLLEIINQQVDSSKQAVATASTDSLAAINLSKKLLGIFALTSLVVTVLLIWLLVSKNILHRLITVIRALKDISEGRLDGKMEVSGRDELGELARTVDIFREKALENKRLQEQEEHAVTERIKQEDENRRMEAEQRQDLDDRQRLERERSERELLQAQALRKDTDSLLQVVIAASEGDLTQSIAVKGEHPTGRLAEGLAALINSFIMVMNQITATTHIVASGTQEIVSGNSLLSDRTEQQTNSLKATAESMLDITKTVNQNSVSAKNANTLVNSAQSHTQKVGSIVSEAVSAMREINDSSAEISAIVGVIDEIAFQTNLLALNAAVEAARAGEQGRGFAVVAAEVRNLAARSGVAAREIKTLIEDSVKKVNHGVELVGHSESTLDELLTSVMKVTDIVGEISVNAENQRIDIETVNNAVSVLEQTTLKNAVMVEQVTGHSTEMAEQTVVLRDQVSFFTFNNIEIDGSDQLDKKAA